MAEIFDFIVNDNRTITYKLTEPIMLEDNGVSDWRFHIPNIVNGLDATGWQWWLVYVNAKGDKYTIPLTLEYDYDRPDAYSIANYTVDYGMSCKVGGIKFSIEAIDTNAGGTILHEWHTKTYSATVEDTLQGNQVEYAETESDIISALLIEVRNKINQLVGGATPLPVSSISEMVDTTKVYILTTDKNWYLYNGSAWVSGGVYGAGVQIDSTLTKPGQAADAKAVGIVKDNLSTLDTECLKRRTVTNTGTDYSVWATNDVNLSEEDDYYVILLNTSGVDVSTRPYMEVRNIYSTGSQEITQVREIGTFVKIQRNFTRTYTRTNIVFLRSDAATATAVTSSWEYAVYKGEPNKGKITKLDEIVTNVKSNLDDTSETVRTTLTNLQYTGIQNNDLITIDSVNIKAGKSFSIEAILESGESTGINIYSNSSSSAAGGVLIQTIPYGNEYELTAPIDTTKVIGYIRGNNNAVVSLTVRIDGKITVMENTIADLNEETITIPPYAKNTVETVKTTLNMLQGSKSITLGFITDIHVNGERNADETQKAMTTSVAALNNIHRENPIDLVILNGDYLYNTSSTAKETAFNWYAGLLKTFSYLNAPLFIGKGNHDANDITGSLTQYISDEEIYRAFSKRGTANFVGNYGYIEKNYGYFDIPNKKTRIIMVNTVDNPFIVENDVIKYKEQNTICIGNRQLNFIANALKFDEDGWGVVFVSHHALQNGSGINPSGSSDYYVPLNQGGTQLLGIINAFRNKTSYSDSSGSGDFVYNIDVDYSANGSNEVIAMLNGHTHRDLDDNVNGIQMIATTAASFIYTAYYADGTKINRVFQDKTETSWDIITINRGNKKIYCTRYGAGADRVFDY